MNKDIQHHIDLILAEYTQGDRYQHLLNAKEQYFKLTGVVFEEDEDYENRMNSFNDWYIFHFIPAGKDKPVIQEYVQEKNIDNDLGASFLNINHSIFEFTGLNLKRHMVLKDILHDKKVLLPLDHPKLSIVKGDLFLGRVITYGDSNYLLSGMCLIPKDVKSLLKKQARKILKLNDPKMVEQYLFQVEAFKTKWSRYGHVEAKKIFQFE